MTSHTTTGYNDYHSSEEVADDAIHWLHEHKRFSPEKPFLIIRPVGHRMAPRQTPKEWEIITGNAVIANGDR